MGLRNRNAFMPNMTTTTVFEDLVALQARASDEAADLSGEVTRLEQQLADTQQQEAATRVVATGLGALLNSSK